MRGLAKIRYVLHCGMLIMNSQLRDLGSALDLYSTNGIFNEYEVVRFRSHIQVITWNN